MRAFQVRGQRALAMTPPHLGVPWADRCRRPKPHDARTCRDTVGVQDGVALGLVLERDHQIGIERFDRRVLQAASDIAADQSAGVDEHAIEPGGARPIDESTRRRHRVEWLARPGRDADEADRHDFGVAEMRQRRDDTTEPDGGRWSDLGLAEIGVDDADRQTAREETVGKIADEGGLAGVGLADDERQTSRGDLIEKTGRYDNVLIAASMRASPSRISSALVA